MGKQQSAGKDTSEEKDVLTTDPTKDREESELIDKLLEDEPDDDETAQGRARQIERGNTRGRSRTQDDVRDDDENTDDDEAGEDAEDDGDGAEEDELDGELDLEFDALEASDDTALESAYRALEADGVSRKSLKQIPRNEVLALARSRAAGRDDDERDAENDETDRRRSTQRKASKIHEAAAKALAPYLVGDEVEAGKAVKGLVDAILSHKDERLERALATVEGQSALMARSRLVERFQQLRSPREFAARLSEARVLVRKGVHASIGRALLAACRDRYADEMSAGSRRAASDERVRRRAGSSLQSGRRGSEQPMNRDTATDAWLSARLDGDKKRAARFEKHLNARPAKR